MRNGQASRYLEKARKRREPKPTPITEYNSVGRPADEHETNISYPKSKYQGWHFQEKRHRQWEKVYWFWGGIFTAAAAIGAIYATIYAKRAYTQTKRQADIAQSAFESADRPWVTLESLQLTSPLSFDAAGNASITIESALINTGKSPAVFVSVHTDLTIKRNIQQALNNQRLYCEKIAKVNEGGVLIAPNKIDFSNVIDKKQVYHDNIESFGPEKSLIPFVSGCIRYKYGSHYFYSGFSFVIAGSPTDKPGVNKELILGKTTPVDQLSLIKMPVGFFAE